MSLLRTTASLLAGVLAGTLVVSPATAAAPVAQPAATGDPSAAITLFTGDKVVLGGQRGAVIEPAGGRERLRFVQQRDEFGDLHVIPEDALPLLRVHRIDPRLFNVTKLVRSGYGDKARKDVPLIVSGGAAQARGKVRDLPSLGGSAVRVSKADGFGPLTSAQRIWLDGPVQAMLDKSVPQIGAPQAWQSGHTGKGATVAVLDTGIDATHPDLAGAVVGAQDFSGSATGAEDHRGHGTHVASIITGAHQKYPGVAPDTKLLNGKVLDDNGFGAESSVIAGMEWAAAQGVRVVNLSLGTLFPSDGTDPMAQAVNRLTAETGTLFVVAAGNRGVLPPGDPGAADAALTVGAVDHDERLASFSSRGPRLGDGAIKPDITAPGVDIAAAKAAHAKSGKPVDDTHVRERLSERVVVGVDPHRLVVDHGRVCPYAGDRDLVDPVRGIGLDVGDAEHVHRSGVATVLGGVVHPDVLDQGVPGVVITVGSDVAVRVDVRRVPRRVEDVQMGHRGAAGVGSSATMSRSTAPAAPPAKSR